jgi:hypothetical protein
VRREEALRELAASFAIDHDHVEWWYVIERDPVYDEVRETAEFRSGRRRGTPPAMLPIRLPATNRA